MKSSSVAVAFAARDSLGEGCLWHPESRQLIWLDIARPSRIHALDPATGVHRVWPSPVLLTAIAARQTGGFILGGEDGVYSFNPDTGVVSPFCQPETDRPHNRFNDGACDAAGRLWIGTMHQNIGPQGEDLAIPAATGALYRVLADGSSQRMLDDVGVSNGPCWSPDGGTFYFSDSMAQIIWAFDFDVANGVLHNQRVFNDTREHGYPDGATVDAEGHVWSARWDGACVLRLDPKGRIAAVVPMPAKRPTCIVFGGEDGETAFVTSSRAHLTAAELAQYQHSGDLLCFRPGVSGPLKNSFAG